MSARVAYVLWHDPERALQPSEGRHLWMAWTEAASDYRALVRSVLRMLEKEGIRIRSAGIDAACPAKTEDWLKKTARFAWFLWLRANRESGRIGVGVEAEIWEVEAASFRRFVRSAMITLEADGIFILK